MFFTGWPGVAVSIGIFILTWVAASIATKGETFTFEQKDGDFEKHLLVYLDIAKFILTLAGGGIVLIISSTALGSAKKLPTQYASPLFILAMSMLYGILFMPFLALNYETFKHKRNSYSRRSYIRNQALGFSALACFCLGYAWLIFAAVQG
jgi:hypothetical protein